MDRTVNPRWRVWFFMVLGCVVLGGLLAGCGSNNPAGPANAVASTTGASVTNASTTTNLTVYGTVLISSGLSGGTADGYGESLKSFVVTIDGKTQASTNPDEKGNFQFRNIPSGIYKFSVTTPSRFAGTSFFVEIPSTGMGFNVPNVFILDSKDVQSIPTMDIKGKLISPLDGKALSVAQVILDGDVGRSTVSDGFGYFYLPYIASGSHVLFISKPGLVASFSVPFKIIGRDGQANADSISFMGKTVNSAANNENDADPASRGLVRLGDMGTISLTYDLTKSANLIGTVYQFVKNSRGEITDQKTFVPFYTFQLWTTDPDKISHFYQWVVTDASGTWKVDNIPTPSGWSWSAMCSAASIQYIYDPTSGELKGSRIVATAPYDTNGDGNFEIPPHLTTSNYVLEAGKTTVMDLVVPPTLSNLGVPSTVTSFAPNPIVRGQALTINGRDFGNDVNVALGQIYFFSAGGVSTVLAGNAITSWSDTQIKVAVPGTMPLGSAQMAIWANSRFSASQTVTISN